MFASFLITFREVLEASLIVATFLGILTRFHQGKHIRFIWMSAALAGLVTASFLGFFSVTGFRLQEVFEEEAKELFEGSMMLVSSVFVTWAVFWLHTYFGKHKMQVLQKIRETTKQKGVLALFGLSFLAIVREGMEIVLFLSTLYLSESPSDILLGAFGGFLTALVLSFLVFQTTLHLPLYHVFRVTSLLLVLFSAGLLKRGLGELFEAGVLPTFLSDPSFFVAFIPEKATLLGSILSVLFGITKSISWFQAVMYLCYVGLMMLSLSPTFFSSRVENK